MNQKSPFVITSSKDIISFLDDVRIALGLSQQQMETLILLLVEAQDAHLHFRIGNMDILFGSDSLEDSEDKKIFVEMCTSQKTTQTPLAIKFRKHTYTRSRKKAHLLI